MFPTVKWKNDPGKQQSEKSGYCKTAPGNATPLSGQSLTRGFVEAADSHFSSDILHVIQLRPGYETVGSG